MPAVIGFWPSSDRSRITSIILKALIPITGTLFDGAMITILYTNDAESTTSSLHPSANGGKHNYILDNSARVIYKHTAWYTAWSKCAVVKSMKWRKGGGARGDL